MVQKLPKNAQNTDAQKKLAVHNYQNRLMKCTKKNREKMLRSR